MGEALQGTNEKLSHRKGTRPHQSRTLILGRLLEMQTGVCLMTWSTAGNEYPFRIKRKRRRKTKKLTLCTALICCHCCLSMHIGMYTNAKLVCNTHRQIKWQICHSLWLSLHYILRGLGRNYVQLILFLNISICFLYYNHYTFLLFFIPFYQFQSERHLHVFFCMFPTQFPWKL